MILTGMTLEQAISLEDTFATLQSNGQWRIPDWLKQLECDLACRDLMQNQEYINHLANSPHLDMHQDFSSREG